MMMFTSHGKVLTTIQTTSQSSTEAAGLSTGPSGIISTSGITSGSCSTNPQILQNTLS